MKNRTGSRKILLIMLFVVILFSFLYYSLGEDTSIKVIKETVEKTIENIPVALKEIDLDTVKNVVSSDAFNNMNISHPMCFF